MNQIKKNLLDLQHSLSLTKGSLFFSVGIGGGIVIFFGIKQFGTDAITSFLAAELFSFFLF